jgi:hypothetical protein
VFKRIESFKFFTIMKRTLLLAALFAVLGVSAWYVLQQKKLQTGTALSPDMDFAIENTNEIGRIFMADRKGQTTTLERKKDFWLYNNKFRARPTAVSSLLETLHNIKVEYIPPNASDPELVKSLATEGIKVEIYNLDNKLVKQYYVGGVTMDERGTYMIMEGSEKPYVMHIPAFIGQVRVRYMMGDDNWRDRAVFVEKPEEIQSVSVEYPKQKSQSFKLEKAAAGAYNVSPFFSTTPVIHKPLRKGIAEAYLLQFENMVSEGFESANPARDSVVSMVPFAIVSLKNMDGTEKKVRFWPLDVETHPVTGQNYVVRYFTDLNDGEAFYLTQHRVFGPIFRGYQFFFE